jgi:quinol-cytochrome oxidoreductase complex cytochrome b subunit/mono/diheme cytochrome c family protein
MKALLDWLDQRTGYRGIVRHSLYENIPGGARWRYIWGSTLSFTLVVQFITGIVLWMSYSPSSQTAWESVYFIQYQMAGGWLLRGIHHYTASVMNVLLVLHLMQVVIDGAYKAPREINFWFGLGLLQLVLGLSLTGYLLPWDQKGYWATKVATNIAGITPVIGTQVQQLAVGGTDYGHHTLTRFFALHAGVLPAAVILLLVWHILLFRRHGITAKEPKRRKDEYFWPEQVLKDAVACLAVMAAILVLVLRDWALRSDGELGAELGAPADPSETYSAARPEWYFLFLFQFLKYFPGGTELWGAIIIPGVIMGIVFAMPIIGRWQLGHRFNIGLLFSLLAGVMLLTYLAMAEDKRDPAFHAAVEEAEHEAHRVKVLAEAGIPPSGAVTLLRNDPFTQGPKLFAKSCANCHRYDGHDGLGNLPTATYVVKTNDTLASIAQSHRMTEAAVLQLNKSQTNKLSPGKELTVNDLPSASDLKGFGSRSWLAGLLDPAHISSEKYFGDTKFKDGKMARFVKRDIAKFSAEEKEKLNKVIAALSSEANLPSQRAADQRDTATIAEGKKLLASEEMRCTECHKFYTKDEDATAPDLAGYGSRQWLVDFIHNPAHEHFYGERNDRMPAFGKEQILNPATIGLIVDWLRGDWYVPHGGAVAGKAKTAAGGNSGPSSN